MAQTIMVFAAFVVVFVILPLILKKLTGRDFTELLIGRPLFGKRKNDAKQGTDQKGSDSKAQGSESGQDGKKEKNSDKSEILQTISSLMNFARRNQYYPIVPGILKKGHMETKLGMIIVMRSGVVGVNLFGYGGAVSAKKDDEMWTQTMNGETRQILSPVNTSRQQEKILRQFLQDLGFKDVDVSVVSVFTSKNVKVTGPSAAEVVHSSLVIGELGKRRYVESKNVDTKKIGTALAAFQVKTKDLQRRSR